MCSETSPPRLSFDLIPVQDHHHHQQPRRDASLLDMNCDFEFSISTCLEQESSSADELFSHGVILPSQPRDRVNTNFTSKQTQNRETPCLNSLPPLPCSENSKKEKLKENTVSISDHLLEQIRPQSTSKSFWGTFKRSSSLNCENKRSLLCSLPLLSRSNSTGSVSSQKRTTSLKEVNKNNSSQKQPLISMLRSSSCSSSSSSSSISNPYTMMQKPPLKKGHGRSYGNGVRIIPVINVPPPYIPKGTAKLFGFGKDRKSKKWLDSNFMVENWDLSIVVHSCYKFFVIFSLFCFSKLVHGLRTWKLVKKKIFLIQKRKRKKKKRGVIFVQLSC